MAQVWHDGGVLESARIVPMAQVWLGQPAAESGL
jgi:hypothetical protein